MTQSSSELISQNTSLISDINKKSEYTKTIEYVFITILELFNKKNAGESQFCQYSSNPKNISSDFINLIELEKGKETFIERRDPHFKEINMDASAKTPLLPMLDYYKSIKSEQESIKVPSVNESPRSAFKLNQCGDDNIFSYIDFLDDRDRSRSNSISSFDLTKQLAKDGRLSPMYYNSDRKFNHINK